MCRRVLLPLLLPRSPSSANDYLHARIITHLTFFNLKTFLCSFLPGGCVQFRFTVVRDVHQRTSGPTADPRADRPGNKWRAPRAHNAVCQ